jgi:hypothetical protein
VRYKDRATPARILLQFDRIQFPRLEGSNPEDFGFGTSDFDFATFRNDVGAALVSYFSDGTVTRGNKAFDIKATSFDVEADVAPFYEHRRYSVSKAGVGATRAGEDGRNEAPRGQDGGQGGMPPGFDQAAETLGVSADALFEAMEAAGGATANLSDVAAALGVEEDALRAAMPTPPAQ